MPLIVFEGLDRSGKSTQVARLADALRARGHCVLRLGFPMRGADNVTGPALARALDAAAGPVDARVLACLFAANRHEYRKRIEDALAVGDVVLVDRYTASGAAYGMANGLAADWLRGLDEGMPRPDVTVFLDVPVAVAAGRPGFGAEAFEHAAFQERVAVAYDALALAEASWTRVAGTAPADVVAEAVAGVVAPVLV